MFYHTSALKNVVPDLPSTWISVYIISTNICVIYLFYVIIFKFILLAIEKTQKKLQATLTSRSKPCV